MEELIQNNKFIFFGVCIANPNYSDLLNDTFKNSKIINNTNGDIYPEEDILFIYPSPYYFKNNRQLWKDNKHLVICTYGLHMEDFMNFKEMGKFVFYEEGCIPLYHKRIIYTHPNQILLKLKLNLLNSEGKNIVLINNPKKYVSEIDDSTTKNFEKYRNILVDKYVQLPKDKYTLHVLEHTNDLIFFIENLNCDVFFYNNNDTPEYVELLEEYEEVYKMLREGESVEF